MFNNGNWNLSSLAEVFLRYKFKSIYLLFIKRMKQCPGIGSKHQEICFWTFNLVN